MSKAEERAKEYVSDLFRRRGQIFQFPKAGDAFLDGYHQAEKDLALSWEDIPKILHHCEQLKTSWWFRDNEQTKLIGTQIFWEEVLKKFNEEKSQDSDS